MKRIAYPTFFSLFLSCLFAVGADFPLEPAYQSTYVGANPAAHRQILSLGKHQYLVKVGTDGVPSLQKIAQGSGKVVEQSALPAVSSEKLKWSNPHRFYSVATDKGKHIHVCGGMYLEKFRCFRSAKPESVAQMTATSAEKSFSYEILSYPTLFQDQRGKLNLIVREGLAGRGVSHLLQFNETSRHWLVEASPLIEGENSNSQYFWPPVVSANGEVHLFWTWRSSSWKTKRGNQDIVSVTWNPATRDWKAGGKPVALPIVQGARPGRNAEMVLEGGLTRGMFNHFDSASHADGDIYLSFSAELEDGSEQIFIAHRSPGQKWKTHRVSQYPKGQEWGQLQQSGRASLPIARPALAIAKDKRVYLITRSFSTDNRIEIFRSAGSSLDKWERAVLADHQVGGWEPNLDRQRWEKDAVFSFVTLGITDTDIPVCGKAQPPQQKPAFLSAVNRFVGRPADDSVKTPMRMPCRNNPLTVGNRFSKGERYLTELGVNDSSLQFVPVQP